MTSILAHVASALFRAQPPYAAESVTTLIGEALRHLDRQESMHALKDLSEDRALEVINDDGVLMATDDRHDGYRFLHRTFQEYLAGVHLASPAVALASGSSPNVDGAISLLADAVAARLADPEVVLLALGYVSLVSHYVGPGIGRDVAGGAIERVLDHCQPAVRTELLALMGPAVTELGVEGMGKDVHGRLALAVLRGDADGPDAEEEAAKDQAKRRAAFGDVLGRIGDTRFLGPEQWHLPNDVVCGWARGREENLFGFVQIPAGDVLMGSDKRPGPWPGNEWPQRRITVSAFFMARWPVTEAQYGGFVRATSYTEGEARTTWRRGWERGRPNCPVASVSWHDAMAYCRWLTDEWRREPWRLPHRLQTSVKKGWSITLPSEAEWERAARRDTDRIYPWGDLIDVTRANYVSTDIGGTSAVGCFPRGATPDGVEELSGNVWEWTRSKHKPYPYDASDGREDVLGTESRVMRGGCSGNHSTFLRCAERSLNEPDTRNDGIGFRLVLSPFRY